jgi:hypothetical protein
LIETAALASIEEVIHPIAIAEIATNDVRREDQSAPMAPRSHFPPDVAKGIGVLIFFLTGLIWLRPPALRH